MAPRIPEARAVEAGGPDPPEDHVRPMTLTSPRTAS
jgi:hypothetical protein